MPKPNFIFKLTVVLFVAVFSSAAFAQTDAKPLADINYEITLQVVAAGGSTEKTMPPPSLDGVIRRLKESYSSRNYYLASTYFQRVAGGGNCEFKGVSNSPDQPQDVYAPIFSDWSVGQIAGNPGERGANAVQLKNFRFGQRVPVKTARIIEETGKTVPVINYENIGITIQKINLAENTPTIIGSVSGSSPENLTFLILTVKTTP